MIACASANVPYGRRTACPAEREAQSVADDRAAGDERATFELEEAIGGGHYQPIHVNQAGIEDIGAVADIQDSSCRRVGHLQGAAVHDHAVVCRSEKLPEKNALRGLNHPSVRYR